MDYRPTRWQRIKRWLIILLLLPYGLTVLYVFVPPVSTLMLAQWLTLSPAKRQWVSLDKISPHLLSAVVAAEDDAFCSHYGFDFKQIEKSMSKAANSSRGPRGASTITQQTAKNLFLWNGRSWIRKILEAPLTLWLEAIWSKRRILEVYLNIAQFDDDVFGAEAASQRYFGIPASKLSPHQASLLAVILPNPIKRSAGNPGAGTQLLAYQLQKRLSVSRPVLSCVKR